MAVVGLALAAGGAYAQVDSDQLWCRSGILKPLALDEKKFVILTENHGVAHGKEGEWFDRSTHKCIGTIASFDGVASGNGWCKQVNAQTGDWAVLDWTYGPEAGKGTWAYRHGVGKWKGISGGGNYENAFPTRAIEEGTYQNCIRVRGKVTIPG